MIVSLIKTKRNAEKERIIACPQVNVDESKITCQNARINYKTKRYYRCAYWLYRLIY